MSVSTRLESFMLNTSTLVVAAEVMATAPLCCRLPIGRLSWGLWKQGLVGSELVQQTQEKCELHGVGAHKGHMGRKPLGPIICFNTPPKVCEAAPPSAPLFTIPKMSVGVRFAVRGRPFYARNHPVERTSPVSRVIPHNTPTIPYLKPCTIP